MFRAKIDKNTLLQDAGKMLSLKAMESAEKQWILLEEEESKREKIVVEYIGLVMVTISQTGRNGIIEEFIGKVSRDYEKVQPSQSNFSTTSVLSQGYKISIYVTLGNDGSLKGSEVGDIRARALVAAIAEDIKKP